MTLNEKITIDEVTGLPVLPEDYFWSIQKTVSSYYNEPGDGIVKYEAGKNLYLATIVKKVLDQPAVEERITYVYRFFSGKKVISTVEPALEATYVYIPECVEYFFEPIVEPNMFVLDELEAHEREQLNNLEADGFKKKVYIKLDLTEENIKKITKRAYLNWIKQGKIEKEQRAQIKENEKREEKYLGKYPPKGL